MPQTLLGLLALSLATLLSFSQQRVTIQSYEVRIRDEYSVAASGLLTQIMELIAARSYDEASTPDWIHTIQRLPTPSDFTPSNHFGRYAPLPGQGRGLALGLLRGRDPVMECNLMRPELTPLCNDVDDFDGISWQRVTVSVGNGRELAFEIRIRVEYVSDTDPTQVVTYPTYSKLVVLRARTPDRPSLGELVRLERVVSFDPIKAEAEYEIEYGPLLTGAS